MEIVTQIEVLSANDPSYAKRLKAMLMTSSSAVKPQLPMHQDNQQHQQQQYFQVTTALSINDSLPVK
jgi:hypothetical protein